MNDHDIVPVRVPCPDCGNVNRKARRACKTCAHTGMVEKFAPRGWADTSGFVDTSTPAANDDPNDTSGPRWTNG